MLDIKRDKSGKVIARKKPLFFQIVLIWGTVTGVTVCDGFTAR